MASLFYHVFVLLNFMISFRSTLSSSNISTTSIIASFETTSFYETTNDESNLKTPTVLKQGEWLYATVAVALLGIILTSIMGVNAIYHLYHDGLNGRWQRAFYIAFFFCYWLMCVAYGFFKTSIVIPGIGSSIGCRFGYYSTTTSANVAKLILFYVFILRIDTAFHASALGYNRCFLGTLIILYTLLWCFLYTWFVYESWNIIEYKLWKNIGQCSIGAEITTAHSILGIAFVFDTIFSIIVCVLFVYKLNKVVKLTSDHDSSSKKNKNKYSRKDSVGSKNHKLLSLMKKQTILVILAILSSFSVIGLGAVYSPISQLAPVDAISNTFCVWLMFSFANEVWNKLIKYACCCFCCCCCCCGGDDHEHLLQRGSTFSQSLRRRVSSMRNETSVMSNSTKTNNNNDNDNDNESPLPPISERNSVKQKSIEINFKNDIKSTDLNQNNNNDNNNNSNNKTKIVVEMEEVQSDEEATVADTPNTP